MSSRVARFADNHPAGFSLLVIAVWLTVGALAVAIISATTGLEALSDTVQRVATLVATVVVLILTGMAGWLRETGLARVGTGYAIPIAVLIGLFYLVATRFAFFDIGLDGLTSAFSTSAGRSILANQLVVGVTEEVAFRGLLMFGLARAWRDRRHGLAWAVIVQALVFGLAHSAALIAGEPLASVAPAVLYDVFSGVSLGLCVLACRAVWPAALAHAISNAAVFDAALHSPWLSPASAGYVRMAGFEALLAMTLILLLWRIGLPEGYSVSNRRIEQTSGARTVG